MTKIRDLLAAPFVILICILGYIVMLIISDESCYYEQIRERLEKDLQLEY